MNLRVSMYEAGVTLQRACGMEVEEVCRALRVDYVRENEHLGTMGAVAGLTAAEASQRRALHGSNELHHDEEDPLWKRFLGQFNDPMIGLLGVSALISVIVGSYDDAISISLVRSHGTRGPHGPCCAIPIPPALMLWPRARRLATLAAVLFIRWLICHCTLHMCGGSLASVLRRWVSCLWCQAVVIVTIVAFVQEYRSDQSLAALSELAPPQCDVYRNGHLRRVATSELVVGDLVELKAGDRVPADLRVTMAVQLTIDESTLTGETTPAKKRVESIAGPAAELADRRNCAYMGTNVVSGRGAGLVVSVGDSTEFGSVFALMRDSGETRTPLQVRVCRRRYGVVCVSALAPTCADSYLNLCGVAPARVVCSTRWTRWASACPSCHWPSSLSSRSWVGSPASRSWRCSPSVSASRSPPSPKDCPSS